MGARRVDMGLWDKRSIESGYANIMHANEVDVNGLSFLWRDEHNVLHVTKP